MDENMKKRNERLAQMVIKGLQSRNMTGYYAEDKEAALKQALEGRMFIIDKMEAVISEPRAEVSENAPKIEVLKINPDKIAGLIGPGGKVIRAIIDETGVSIDIDDDEIPF